MSKPQKLLFLLFFLIGCTSYMYPASGPESSRFVLIHLLFFLGLAMAVKNIWIKYLWIIFVVNAHLYNYQETVIALYKILIFIGIYIFIIHKCKERDLTFFLNIFCVLCIINVIYAWIQWFGLTSYVLSVYPVQVIKYANKANTGFELGQIPGLMHNPNHLTALIGLTLPCFMRRKWIWCLIFILPLFVLPDLRNHGRMGLVMTVFVLGYFSFIKDKRLFFILAVLGIGFFTYKAFNGFFNIGEDRLIYWKATLEHINGIQWWFGNGIGTFDKRLPVPTQPGNITIYRAHNEYIELLYAAGIPALIAVIGYLGQFTWRFIHIKKDIKTHIIICGLLCLAINCITNFTFHIMVLGIIGIIYIAIWEIRQGGSSEKN